MKEKRINLRAITKANFDQIANLKVFSKQEHLVAPNLYTIAQMQFKEEKIALGIFDEEVPVGLIAYDLDDYDIWRLMIDEKFQGRGFGTQAMQQVIEILKNHGKLPEIRTSVILDNEGAKTFYERLGFIENGNILSYNAEGNPKEVELVLKWN